MIRGTPGLIYAPGMQKRILVAVTLLLGAAACPPPVDRCGDEVCTKEQRCTPEKKCVTDGRPVLTIETPVDMAIVTTDFIEVRGNAKDDEKPPVTEVATGPIWVPAPLEGDGWLSGRAVTRRRSS